MFLLKLFLILYLLIAIFGVVLWANAQRPITLLPLIKASFMAISPLHIMVFWGVVFLMYSSGEQAYFDDEN